MANPSLYTVKMEEEVPGIIGDKFERSVEDTIDFLKTISKELSEKWVIFAREEAPEEYGIFKESIISQTFDNESEIGFRANRSNPLGNFIIYGVQEHEIYPKSPGGILAFYWERGPKGPGDYAFYSVNHPGQKSNDYFSRALDRLDQEVERSITELGGKWILSFQGTGSFI